MTPKQEAALRQAREALKKCDSALAEELSAWDIDPPLHHVLEASNACGPAIAAIDEALAEQPAQQEPVAYLVYDFDAESQYLAFDEELGDMDGCEVTPLYTSPPASKPLTDEQIMEMYNEPRSDAEMLEFARAIEAAHGIKENT